MDPKRTNVRLSPFLFASALALAGPAAHSAADPSGIEFFEKRVRAVLVEHCYRCHSAQARSPKGWLRLDSRDGLLKGGSSGPAVVPGKPEESLLLRAVRHAPDMSPMPPKGKLSDRAVADLARWVSLGAPDPRAAAPSEANVMGHQPGRNHWAFRPLHFPAPPSVKDRRWARTPIDCFLLARMEARDLKPSPAADRRTLIRRVTFDLTGLPPTPEEADAFLADRSADAYEKLVDRLLASPAYGEHWGRHWLDVARYADTAGETADFPAPQAWRYRNYVLAAFNADRPYDQFIREQVAGDLLASSAPRGRYAELVTATGYLAVARRFGFDPNKDQYLTIEDTIDTLGKSVLGLTLGCARCHDHKYDPVSSADYYALYGIFESTRYAFPGSEKDKRPHDLVPLVPPAELAGAKKPAAVAMAYAVREGTPHNVRRQRGGDPDNPGEEVPRRFLSLFGGQPVPPGGGSGRLALAGWLTGPAAPLAARVLVNRVWQHHFGEGLVRTPNDFGTRGSPPSHPELLDYLADRFVSGGWSVKKLHRLILLSAAYQQASFPDPAAARADPDNLLLARFARRRLGAEEIRDAILAVSGDLDRTPGGPHPFADEKTWGFTQHNPFSAVYDHDRRSVYLMTQRIKRHPFLGLFDGADPSSSTGRREATTVPTQALFFMNDPFVHAKSARLAERLLALPDDGARLDRLYRLCFGRPPAPVEAGVMARFLTGASHDLGNPRQAWAGCVRVLLASNEFLYVD